MSGQQKLCDSCGINFEKMSNFAFKEHMLKHKEKTHVTNAQVLFTLHARDLRYHKLKVLCKKVFCECCNIAFSNKTNLQKHMNKNVKKADVPNEIEVKKKMPSNNTTRISCDDCKKDFVSQKSLLNHQRNTHSPMNTCTVCEKTFSNKDSFKRHIRQSHSTEKSFGHN